ncbi:hypothetical protein CLV94_1249 [Flavobacterium endophyticum]|uniref:Uncharacterized protein n=1 Tax=Flavobacterium endophyticum TaxID=1540163 RepID=A0A495MM99_9FLAO|nr:hypothetical protein [Flavobacterium endophyticum]RKS26192.1 hypothetical protein CLV94_1249 [Flavobacterium endophyticum]
MKYKYSIVIIIVLLIIASIIQNKNSDKEKKVSHLMSNNIKFSGIITDLKISKNHTFGVITLKINETNDKKFNPIINEKYLFPYAIKDSVAEIYTTVSDILKRGDSVKVDSDNKEVVFSNKNGILYLGQIYITSVKRDIEFVKENSILIK